MNNVEISANVERFRDAMSNNHRYRSFDYCYNYFRSNIKHVAGDNMEESCMRLWAYLASWGMLRGSSKLLQYNPAVLQPLVEYINDKCEPWYWDIDVDNYPQHAEVVVGIYSAIAKILSGIKDEHDKNNVTATDTLVTKIMLGIFGNVPAFDQYFKKSLKGWLNVGTIPSKFETRLGLLYDFYLANQAEIDGIQDFPVLRFDGSTSPFIYPKAKIIDMWGFSKGINEKD